MYEGETSAAGGGGGDPPKPEEQLSPEDEIKAWLRYLLAQNFGKMPLDDIGMAVYEGGVAEGYRQYLEKVKNNRLVVKPRTWASDPKSQAYKDREAAFQNNMLLKLRNTPIQPYKDSERPASFFAGVGKGLARHSSSCLLRVPLTSPAAPHAFKFQLRSLAISRGWKTRLRHLRSLQAAKSRVKPPVQPLIVSSVTVQGYGASPFEDILPGEMPPMGIGPPVSSEVARESSVERVGMGV
ncbi:hypothetical protein KFL_008980020 [Klebsormidium nitens]|uniref:Uncharacterized protein n=1 Tax=Klebsormidium nitens TaxID=105231 RepID=A0A1Y1IT60_KLENI|nr:hypothetical protein KFL_008980020 [Klebsormidium nitens]|eukprot:GAQ91986.1 hypothetical protein KFL_008980020 [Klebsormidium nitens]